MRQMAVNLAGVELKNPVMTASGTFGSGAEWQMCRGQAIRPRVLRRCTAA